MADSRLGLNELEAVLAVARRASFRLAAIDLDVSTTALSNTIAKLEASLETRLFNRTTRSVFPTEVGARLLELIADGFEVADAGLQLRDLAILFREPPVAVGELRLRVLRRVLADWSPKVPGLYLYYSSRRHMLPALRAFIDCMLDRDISTDDPSMSESFR